MSHLHVFPSYTHVIAKSVMSTITMVVSVFAVQITFLLLHFLLVHHKSSHDFWKRAPGLREPPGTGRRGWQPIGSEN